MTTPATPTSALAVSDTATTPAGGPMVTIGSQINVTTIAARGAVIAFYCGTGYRRNLIEGVWLRTDVGRIPVRLRRGTQYTLPDGTVGRIP